MSRKSKSQNRPIAVLKFSAVIKIRGINPYVTVSAHRAAKLKPAWRRPLPVLVRVNGHPEKPWRINMMPTGDGSFYLYLHGHVRNASRSKVGDRVKLELQFDPAYKNGPMHPLPSWFRSPLRQNPAATAAWDALPPSRKKEVLRYFSHLKSPEAKQRNLERALRVLSNKSERFMSRTWKNGK